MCWSSRQIPPFDSLKFPFREILLKCSIKQTMKGSGKFSDVDVFSKNSKVVNLFDKEEDACS